MDCESFQAGIPFFTPSKTQIYFAVKQRSFSFCFNNSKIHLKILMKPVSNPFNYFRDDILLMSLCEKSARLRFFFSETALLLMKQQTSFNYSYAENFACVILVGAFSFKREKARLLQ